MRSFFAPKPTHLPVHSDSKTDAIPDDSPVIPSTEWIWGEFAEAVRYSSDEDPDNEDLNDDLADGIDEQGASSGAAPPRKKQKLGVPYRVQRAQRSEAHKQRKAAKLAAWQEALADIQKLFKSKRTNFVSGDQGLQAKRAKAIETHLRLVLQNERRSIDASQRAAEAGGFAARSGGYALRRWTRVYIESRKLPVSRQGRHAKVYSLLSDPDIAAELRAYVRSNKWAMDPVKLNKFTKNKLVPQAADKYLRHLVDNEMPQGLKKYMEVELFPRIHLKAGHGISLVTARRWLHSEGFKYTTHKKGLYFDGHDRPDVVQYRQNVFLPAMKAFEPRLVRYEVGDVEKEMIIPRANYVERRLVLMPQDEMTSQANDIMPKMWVYQQQYMLRKKGPGRGLHQSETINSVVGWLKGGSQTLEYGKNYEGYWTGELFVKQVRQCYICLGLPLILNSQLKERIIPAFEEALGPGYQALIIVDNSQGHSAYGKDALVATRMNVNPGGNQPQMHDTWFIQDREKITQTMVYPPSHPKYPNMPKRIKAVLTERGLYQSNLRGKCTKKCVSENCCNKRILEYQPDFQAQKSLVQETIEALGHLCLILPKFHCELNFIEFFWGAVKKYLRDNCDYTFDTLKENMPKALESVSVQTIRRWEHRMFRWMEAYRSGLGTAEAQQQVKKFSSTTYRSHRRVPEVHD